ncbi:hypothetical protein BMG05_05950 [Mycobacterium malmoense]|nr:hypothetical protein BMG05_05950 [Mycobacterium malmoense]
MNSDNTILRLAGGRAHATDCWDLTVAELAWQEPKLRVFAVGLPGRGRNPADLATVTIADLVNSVPRRRFRARA